MRKTIVLGSLLLATAANSIESVESARMWAQVSFAQLTRARLKPRKATRVVNLTGYVSLSGSGFVNQPDGGSVMITLHGTATLTDPSGASANASFSPTQTFFITGNYASGYVYPNAYVQVYKNGRLIGSVNVSGSIHVSGFVSGTVLNLSGSGQVSGSGSVQD